MNLHREAVPSCPMVISASAYFTGCLSMRWIKRFASCGVSSRGVRALLLAGWGAAVACGFVVLMGYQNAPGQPASPPATWPDDSALTPGAARGTLVLFAHPRCPCTRATMGELERIMRYARGQVEAYVVFVQPADYAAAWVRAHLWKRAEAIPGATPVRDPGGQETRRFGAFTSGQVLLYDAAHRLQFAGGITGSRGHEGNNKGRQAVLRWIQDGTADRTSTFVFGCALQPAPMNAWKTFRFEGAARPTHTHAHRPADS